MAEQNIVHRQPSSPSKSVTKDNEQQQTMKKEQGKTPVKERFTTPTSPLFSSPLATSSSSNSNSPTSSVRPILPTAVLVKLIVFSILVLTVPLGTYFYLTAAMEIDQLYAAISAVIAANGILFAYVLTAVMEERSVSKPKSMLNKPKRS